MSRKPRILIGSIGLDGHELGALIVSRALQDAGMEVVYLGLNLTPDQVVESAIQEDVDIIGISSMSGIHLEALSDLLELIKKKGAENISVIVGGIIPQEDIPVLEKLGVKKVFPAGASTSEIIQFIRSSYQEPQSKDA
ncbi:MAG: methylmalonyl-CoA mutase [Deltaproteobacteria bacterium]|nr:cobalamin B12-binding domain-containing protein [Deltaproteobacteria bacterium]MBW1933227.1 cobalamin B12-binding domain-containing protein [Deltaproteobacteria bacterium]RLB35142.1 MAG: methylmalonyl-CoA mutase [Deltaproteobacteria bacterium]